MKHTLQSKVRQIAQSPVTQKAVTSMKPEKSVWGFLGIVLFFILPEVVAFIWGAEITAYAKEALRHTVSTLDKYYFDLLVMLFEDGGSWFNLVLGAVLLIWLFV
ncbi:hypothetical protein [Sulfuricurvum sp.]|uniref:hypothetical protein n=1 Tax=Sulfuricurvum sp. TaxID=2025608 RepID=UPI0025F440E5|nr:hypothetical protein [Sulfuricurvum sp.]